MYGTLLRRLAGDNHWRLKQVALSDPTLKLVDQHPENWVPNELQPQKTDSPPNAVEFCGELCGWDFVRKNLVEWRFSPDAQGEVGFPIVRPPKEIPPPIPPEYRVVDVTRVGFNLWHTRAFFSYTANCNNCSSEPPVICIELGDVYLDKKNGVWNLNHYSAMVL
jgi:hypothetical protein